MEELDQFKKGHQALNCHAREFVRALDALSEDTIFNGGVALGPKLGKIRIQLERDFHPDLARNFASEKTDHHILNIAYHLSKENQQVVLDTKDVNLR